MSSLRDPNLDWLISIIAPNVYRGMSDVDQATVIKRHMAMITIHR